MLKNQNNQNYYRARKIKKFLDDQRIIYSNLIKIKIDFIDEVELNAHVEKANNIYLIRLSSGIFKTIKEKIIYFLKDIDFNEYHIKAYKSKMNIFRIFNLNEDPKRIYNDIANKVLCNILFHEVGHIVLGHVDYYSNGFNENENIAAKIKGNYYFQSLEMQADFLGAYYGLFADFKCFKNINYQKINIYVPKTYTFIKSQLLNYYIAFYITMISFDDIGDINNKLYNCNDFKNRTHPHRFERIFYIIHSFYELFPYILNNFATKTKLNECFEYIENILFDSSLALEKIIYSINYFDLTELNDSSILCFYYCLLRNHKILDRSKKFHNISRISIKPLTKRIIKEYYLHSIFSKTNF